MPPARTPAAPVHPPGHEGEARRPAVVAGDTVALARRKLTALFAEAGLDSPALDARVLVQDALCCSHAALAAAPERALSTEQANAVDARAKRRLQGEPVAYIVGRKEFWGLALHVSPATLVPRPETEAVVEAALAALPCELRRRPLRVADLGTGSGAILLALLAELPNAVGIGIDISAAAARVARENARRLGFAERALFVVGDLARPLASGAGIDLIVSNPPYVESGSLRELPREVRDYEPRVALDGGPDGLRVYRRIVTEAAGALAPAGLIAVEIGDGQAQRVNALFAACGLVPACAAKHDLAGRERALVFRRA